MGSYEYVFNIISATVIATHCIAETGHGMIVVFLKGIMP